MVYFMDNPIKMDDDWGGTSVSGNLHMLHLLHLVLKQPPVAEAKWLNSMVYGRYNSR